MNNKNSQGCPFCSSIYYCCTFQRSNLTCLNFVNGCFNPRPQNRFFFAFVAIYANLGESQSLFVHRNHTNMIQMFPLFFEGTYLVLFKSPCLMVHVLSHLTVLLSLCLSRMCLWSPQYKTHVRASTVKAMFFVAFVHKALLTEHSRMLEAVGRTSSYQCCT